MASLCSLFISMTSAAMMATPDGPTYVPTSELYHHSSDVTIASGTAGMYAIVNKYDLGEYDLSTGALTTVSRPDIPVYAYTGENIGCLDNVNGIYYMIYEEEGNKTYTGLYPFNLVDPNSKYDTIKLSMIYPDDVIGANDICISNPTTGDVYMWGKTRDLKETILIKVAYAGNGEFNISTIGNYSVNTHQNAEPGSIGVYDNKRNYIWMSGYDDNRKWAYFYINVITGELNKSIEVDYYAYDSLYYDIKLDYIVGVSINQNGNGYFDLTFQYLDPVSFDVVKTFDANDNNYCGLSTIFNEDVNNGTFYQITYKLMTTTDCMNRNDLEGFITAIDVNTGKVLYDVGICPGMVNCPWDIKYWEPVSNK